jgi:hypothetical protein
MARLLALVLEKLFTMRITGADQLVKIHSEGRETLKISAVGGDRSDSVVKELFLQFDRLHTGKPFQLPGRQG